MAEHTSWPTDGSWRAFLQRLLSSWRRIRRWWGSEAGRYNVLYFWLLIATLTGMLIGYKSGQADQSARYAELLINVQRSEATSAENRCFTILVASLIQPDRYVVPARCLPIIENWLASMHEPPATPDPATGEIHDAE